MKRRICNICLVLAITGLFIFLALTDFLKSYLRLGEVFKDLGKSLKLYYYMIFDKPYYGELGLSQSSNVIHNQIKLPKTFIGFKGKVVAYFSLVFSKENFTCWLTDFGWWLYDAFYYLSFIIPLIIILFFVMKMIYNKTNNNYGRDTLPLKIFKLTCKCFILPITTTIKDFIVFVKEHKFIWVCWVIVWLFSFNLVSIAVGIIAYYFYVISTFDFGGFYSQVYKLILDLQVLFNGYAVIVVLVGAISLFLRFRKNIALNRLRRCEARNCGFVKELPIVSITCGSMGKKKTTLITDMVLSQEKMFRQKALDILIENDMKFPYFPWIHFELDLQQKIEENKIFNLATIKDFIDEKRRLFEDGYDKSHLYGYDGDRDSYYHDDGLKIVDIFDVLKVYGQAYFIYIIETSLIISNYSIRTDNYLMTEGNLPFWAMDFFPKDSRNGGRHSHILDFDLLRLGKKVLENNPIAGSFEFGVVAITEIGKERGNNLELKEVKKNEETANQKNDLFNAWLKMCRHSSTVDNFPFIKVFCDEQRPESWGADARDLSEVIHIQNSSELRLALPFFTIEDMISEWLFGKFMNIYLDFRYKRGDNTLFVYLLKKITARLYNRQKRIYNQYGYCVVFLQKETGTLEGKVYKKRYYLMNKKIYSNRFTTDCFSDYFNAMSKKTSVGLKDYYEYETEKASVEELKLQHSYFVNSLYKDEGTGSD